VYPPPANILATPMTLVCRYVLGISRSNSYIKNIVPVRVTGAESMSAWAVLLAGGLPVIERQLTVDIDCTCTLHVSVIKLFCVGKPFAYPLIM